MTMPDALDIALRLFVILAMGLSAWEAYRRMPAEKRLSFASTLLLCLWLLVFLALLAVLIVAIFVVEAWPARILSGILALAWCAAGLRITARLQVFLVRKRSPAPDAARDTDINAR